MMNESNYDEDSTSKKVTYLKVGRTLSKRTSAGPKQSPAFSEQDMPKMNPNVPEISSITKNEPFINRNYLCIKNGLLRITLIVNFRFEFFGFD